MTPDRIMNLIQKKAENVGKGKCIAKYTFPLILKFLQKITNIHTVTVY